MTSRLSFGTNRFAFPDPVRLAKSCRETEAAGFDHLWFPDSQLHMGDVFINLVTAAQNTERASVGTLIVNPVTRHPSVIASSIATVDLYAPGRTLMCMAAGDTSVLQVGLRPARIDELETAVRIVRVLLAGQSVEMGWSRPTRLDHPRPVPVIVTAGGPRGLAMAGRSADGVVIRVGADPELINWAYQQFRTAALDAGRDPGALFTAVHLHTIITDDPDLAAARGRVMAAGYYEVNRALWERLQLKWPCAPLREILSIVSPDFHHAEDMALAARMVAEIPLEIARRFCLMGNAVQVRDQLSKLVAQSPWLRHIILQPNIPGREFIAACGSAIIPAFA
ncbi:MAG TPA: LLM class flavin-dependent oxidoreductase [Candidatus Binataceae bacterium]|nr:LLM class flavin-dependent oxidoreductase [Candidatus Binataceae bacterium]